MRVCQIESLVCICSTVTGPRVRYQDVAVFLVQPAAVQQQAFTAEERLRFSHSYGYCVNPFLILPCATAMNDSLIL